MLRTCCLPPSRRGLLGFTLVELLVVVAIIGVLVGLLMPAIQAARESARKAICKNHLKQIGLAVNAHLAAHGHFPTGGWGHRWTGDPDRGFGRQQPGGWVYNLLPFVEQQSIHSLGSGLPDTEKNAAAAQRISAPLSPIFSCPSRRAPMQYSNSTFPYRNRLSNSDAPELVTRGDYAVNIGHDGANYLDNGGPKSLPEAETFRFPDADDYSGVSFARSEISTRQITDGLTNTLLIGEKYLDPDCYDTSCDISDWGHAYGGFSQNSFRNAGAEYLPLRDYEGRIRASRFGSAHAFCHFVLCDGSVRAVSYEIDRDVYNAFGNRSDGAVAAYFVE